MPARKRTLKKSSRKKKSSRTAPGRSFEQLVAVMARLRAPNGCPWDREQSHQTLRTYLIEEAYEVLDALDSRDDAKFADELGDLLLQVLFHAQIASEQKRFDITAVIRAIHDKMIRRHPHVFGGARAKNSAEVLRNWELIKQRERVASGPEKSESSGSLLDGVPRGLPALLEGFQLTRKAARVGFDWHGVDGIFEKLDEEAAELREVLAQTQSAKTPSKKLETTVESEVGDVLFVAVNLARFLKIDPEIAMKKASAKFSRRFREMERIAAENGSTFAATPRPQMEALWDQAKSRLSPTSNK